MHVLPAILSYTSRPEAIRKRFPLELLHGSVDMEMVWVVLSVLAALCAFVACMIMLLPARSNHRERDESSASDRMVVFSIGGGRRVG